MNPQPIVIFGGFLSVPSIYEGMRSHLLALTGQPVSIVPAYTHHWLTAVAASGWALLLRKVDAAVREAALASPTGKVTLVGHSSGGVMSRLYLGSKPFAGHIFNGIEVVDTLCTLGSPHYNHTGGRLRNRVNALYPDSFFSPQVMYVSVAGKALQGRRDGTRAERRLFGAYKRLCGDGAAWGDGLVPLESALLKGSEQVVLDGANHYGFRGNPWYGTPRLIGKWWNSVT
jgi:hypothetical protein